MMKGKDYSIWAHYIQRYMCSSSFGKGMIGSNLSRNQFGKSISRLSVCLCGVVVVGCLRDGLGAKSYS